MPTLPEVGASGPVLAARAVTVRRGGAVLLDGVDLTVRPGERWALLGGNGAGKTTLLAVLGARTFPTSGTVDVLGRRLGRVAVQDLWPSIGQVSGAHVPAGRLTCRQVVLTGAWSTAALPLRAAPAPDVAERVAALCVALGLERVADAPWSTLSAGERGRALVARALVNDPPLLLLDEPAAGLDLPARERLVAALDALSDTRPERAAVLVTHHVEELPARTTHALLLRRGRVLAAGPVREVLADEPMSTCFELPLRVARENGRWSARGVEPAGSAGVLPGTAGTGLGMSDAPRESSSGATAGLPGANAAPQNSELTDDERDETVAMGGVAPLPADDEAPPRRTGDSPPVAPGDAAPVVPEYAGVPDTGVVSSVGEHAAAAGDVVDVVTGEHAKLEGVFREVLELVEAEDRAALRVRWGGVVRELLEHERAQERVVLPAVDASVAEQVRARSGELVARLQEQDALNSDAPPEQVRETIELARAHLQAVDEAVVPLLRELPAAERMRLGEDVRQVVG